MSGCFLIVGGTFEERVKKAIEITKQSPENNPDFFLINDELPIGINKIRDLQIWLSLKPYQQKTKSVVISNAQNLTIEAQNALLKTLEEPHQNSTIILCVPSSDWLLPTVVSRCHIIQLPLKPQVFLTQEEFKQFQEVFKKITSPNIGTRWKAIENLNIYQERIKSIEWIDKMTFFVRKILIEQIIESKPKRYPPAKLFKILKFLNLAKIYLQANTNVRITLEVFLLDLPDLS